jgi:hypothetical protein
VILTVLSCRISSQTNEAEICEEDCNSENQPIVTAAIPDLLSDRNQLYALQRDTSIAPQQPRGLSIPCYYRSTPTNEIDKSLPLLRLAFPELFLNGDADIIAHEGVLLSIRHMCSIW